MHAAARRALWIAGAACALTAAPAFAGPLGLNPGDVVTSISFDADKNVSGDGAAYTVIDQQVNADGRFTSVTIVGPTTNPLSGVDLTIQALLNAQNANILGFPVIQANAFFGSVPGGGPDFVVKELGVNILTGNFVGNLLLSGNVDVSNASPQVMSGVALVAFTGGNGQLLNALGGIGGQANLLLTGSLFDFVPGLANLAGDGNVFNSDFTFSLSGTLIPLQSDPFVPEPSTALLLGGGLLGLIGVTRRARARRS